MLLKHSETTEQIISAFYTVYNKLGYGFLEKVYENSLAIELKKRGVGVQQQFPIEVYYEGERVGNYFADLFVDQRVIMELKAADGLVDENFAQLLNYLKATEIDVGLILNFGPKPEFKRKVYETARKKIPPTEP